MIQESYRLVKKKCVLRTFYDHKYELFAIIAEKPHKSGKMLFVFVSKNEPQQKRKLQEANEFLAALFHFILHALPLRSAERVASAISEALKVHIQYRAVTRFK